MEAPHAPRELEKLEHPVLRAQMQAREVDDHLQMVARASGRGRAAAYATDRMLLSECEDRALMRVATTRPAVSALYDSYRGRSAQFGLADAYPSRKRGFDMPVPPTNRGPLSDNY